MLEIFIRIRLWHQEKKDCTWQFLTDLRHEATLFYFNDPSHHSGFLGVNCLVEILDNGLVRSPYLHSLSVEENAVMDGSVTLNSQVAMRVQSNEG